MKRKPGPGLGSGSMALSCPTLARPTRASRPGDRCRARRLRSASSLAIPHISGGCSSGSNLTTSWTHRQRPCGCRWRRWCLGGVDPVRRFRNRIEAQHCEFSRSALPAIAHRAPCSKGRPMSTTIALLNDDEVRGCTPANDEAGFGTLTTARGGLPLQALDVQARIDGLLAEVSVSQTFVNPLDEPLEATYIFPLPDRAAVTRFQMQVGKRVVEGVLKERGQARQEYTQAIQQGHRAAITEEDRPGVFSLRVGNLMPGESATVRLTLTGPLTYSEGEATFRFPLV